jgi:hypothetical protein
MGIRLALSAFPQRITPFERRGRKRETNMQTFQRNEHYTDRGHYAVMTRTCVVNSAQLTRIADRLRSNAENLALSTNPPTFENCRIAGAMVSWAFSIAPLRIGEPFDF